MSLRLVAVAFDADDPDELARFWAGLLTRTADSAATGVLLPGTETQVGLRFVAPSSTRSDPNRSHLHLTSTSLDDQQNTVDRALRLGASHLDVGQGAEDEHVVLADPGGNAFCVIQPDNAYLAGTGFLGEVTCQGSRAVGLFWRDALGWPLVWDRGPQTAIQSPLGGTKLSWDEKGMVPVSGRRGQRFDLVTDDVGAETERLVGLGASRVGERTGLVLLGDPDGNEFSVSPD